MTKQNANPRPIFRSSSTPPNRHLAISIIYFGNVRNARKLWIEPADVLIYLFVMFLSAHNVRTLNVQIRIFFHKI